MPLIPPFAYGRANMFGQYPIRAPKRTGRIAGTTPLLPKPTTPSNPLQSLGIPQPQAEKLLQEIAENHDKPYHAGRLWNGKAYLITQNDKIYYGNPAHLEKLTYVAAYRTKCIDHQVRRFLTADGLSITVSNQHGQQWATANTRLLCVTLPLPHRTQAAFHPEKHHPAPSTNA